jgi:hypothetical protein
VRRGGLSAGDLASAINALADTVSEFGIRHIYCRPLRSAGGRRSGLRTEEASMRASRSIELGKPLEAPVRSMSSRNFEQALGLL